jgi:hypothetical protein
VRRYFELQGYFVRSNIPYKFIKATGGAGWSDIDLCAFHPVRGDALAVEVKGWHTEAITPSHSRDWPSMFYFTRPEATQAIREAIGDRDFDRFLVVGRIGVRGRDEVLAYAHSQGVKILEFKDILKELIDRTEAGRTADSGYEHMIRVLNAYGYLSVP